MSLSGLHLVNHGGKCCGVKTIYGFGYDTAAKSIMQSKLDKIARNNKDQNGFDVESDERFFTDEAPQEVATERLRRYIDFMKKHRPQNIVEVVLAETKYEWSNQYAAWNDELLSLGFKEVTSGKNSNSGNICHIYHLVIDEGGISDDEDE